MGREDCGHLVLLTHNGLMPDHDVMCMSNAS